MMSLRLCALFFLALAAGSLAEGDSPKLPFKIQIGTGCSATAVAKDTILTIGMCFIMSGMSIEATVRPVGIDLDDSGDKYVPNRIVHHPNQHEDGAPMDYVLITLDKEIDGGDGFNAAELPKEEVTLTEGQLCTIVRRSPDQPTTSTTWYDMEFYTVRIINHAKCKEDYICVGPKDDNSTYPNNECHGLPGGPLVCDGKIVAIDNCDFACFHEACAFRKISSLRDFIGL